MKTPFTPEQFFKVFESYNLAVFPAQLVIAILALFSLWLIHRKVVNKNKLIGLFLGLLWIWTGVVYHIGFFSLINPVARVFGGIFIIEGLIILNSILRNRLQFSFGNTLTDYLGYFFILFGLIFYPLIGWAIYKETTEIISLGLPCPTTIFTFGFFILGRSRFPMYLLIIPVLWASLGVTAAINFGVYQDFMLIISAIFTLAIVFFERKSILKYEKL